METGKQRTNTAPMLASNRGAELPIARAQQLELETVLVAGGLEHVLVVEPETVPEVAQALGVGPAVAQARVIVPVAAELELAPVEAVLAPSHRRDQPALLAKTK